MTQAQELEHTIAAVCPECGAERPGQAHDPLCPHADDTIVSTGEVEAHEPIGMPPTPITPIKADEPTIKPPETGQNPDAGWILKITPEHHCILPTIDDRTFVGSIWRCGTCAQDWLVYQKRGKQSGTKAFKKITAEKAEQLLASKGQ